MKSEARPRRAADRVGDRTRRVRVSFLATVNSLTTKDIRPLPIAARWANRNLESCSATLCKKRKFARTFFATSDLKARVTYVWSGEGRGDTVTIAEIMQFNLQSLCLHAKYVCALWKKRERERERSNRYTTRQIELNKLGFLTRRTNRRNSFSEILVFL